MVYSSMYSLTILYKNMYVYAMHACIQAYMYIFFFYDQPSSSFEYDRLSVIYEKQLLKPENSSDLFSQRNLYGIFLI